MKSSVDKKQNGRDDAMHTQSSSTPRDFMFLGQPSSHVILGVRCSEEFGQTRWWCIVQMSDGHKELWELSSKT